MTILTLGTPPTEVARAISVAALSIRSYSVLQFLSISFLLVLASACGMISISNRLQARRTKTTKPANDLKSEPFYGTPLTEVCQQLQWAREGVRT